MLLGTPALAASQHYSEPHSVETVSFYFEIGSTFMSFSRELLKSLCMEYDRDLENW